MPTRSIKLDHNSMQKYIIALLLKGLATDPSAVELPEGPDLVAAANRFEQSESTDASRDGDEVAAFLLGRVQQLSSPDREAYVRKTLAQVTAYYVRHLLTDGDGFPETVSLHESWWRRQAAEARLPVYLPISPEDEPFGPTEHFWWIAWITHPALEQVLAGDFSQIRCRPKEMKNGAAIADGLIGAVELLAGADLRAPRPVGVSDRSAEWMNFVLAWHEWREGTESLPIYRADNRRHSACGRLNIRPSADDAARLSDSYPEMVELVGGFLAPFEENRGWRIDLYLRGVASAWWLRRRDEFEPLAAFWLREDLTPFERYLRWCVAQTEYVVLSDDPGSELVTVAKAHKMRTPPTPSAEEVRREVNTLSRWWYGERLPD